VKKKLALDFLREGELFFPIKKILSDENFDSRNQEEIGFNFGSSVSDSGVGTQMP
jgi:hypothetical protein